MEIYKKRIQFLATIYKSINLNTQYKNAVYIATPFSEPILCLYVHTVFLRPWL